MPRTASTKQFLIPRFAHDLNAFAAKAGLSVSFTTDNTARYPVNELYAVWRGTRKQMLATGLFNRCYHFPLTSAGFRNQMISGHVSIEKHGVEAGINCGEIPQKIEKKGDIEIVYYEGEIAYYGTREALVSEGYCTEKCFGRKLLNKRGPNNHDQETPRWKCHARPNGLYLFYKETDGHTRKRLAEDREWKRSQTEGNRPDYKSPEEWLERKEDLLGHAVRYFLLEECSVENSSGLRYSANLADFAAIVNEIEVIAQRIRDIPVKVDSLEPKEEIATPETREKSASASNDGEFQRFMSRLLPDGKR